MSERGVYKPPASRGARRVPLLLCKRGRGKGLRKGGGGFLPFEDLGWGLFGSVDGGGWGVDGFSE